ncbi:tRNA-intron-encoded endonuclease [Cryptosporidium sp. chipmunk genotype I]|uniref:tRNA-intron-encoded endonuclease n=1 Tax=Cryptosporidium sp. chipmunk genotype I TaxID=1280935 RepID=UPI003519E54B|nr:tRNA-intron-encoded endonuclease [Cryptosporidium sp. chipmunk genotype I]
MKVKDKLIEFRFTKPFYFILDGVIAIPEINENIHLKFIENLYLKFNLGSKKVEETHDQISFQYIFNIYEIIYIGEKYEHYDILFKVKGLVDDKNEPFKITYENISNIYKRFYLNKENLILLKYIIYKYFKEKNYIVKDGLKFGVDFILYHKSPSLVHGKHCILICKFTYGEEDDESDQLKYDGYEEVIYNNKTYIVKFPIINYKKIINLSRLCESVSKKLILIEYNSKNDEVQSLEISRFSS